MAFSVSRLNRSARDLYASYADYAVTILDISSVFTELKSITIAWLSYRSKAAYSSTAAVFGRGLIPSMISPSPVYQNALRYAAC